MGSLAVGWTRGHTHTHTGSRIDHSNTSRSPDTPNPEQRWDRMASLDAKEIAFSKWLVMFNPRPDPSPFLPVCLCSVFMCVLMAFYLHRELKAGREKQTGISLLPSDLSVKFQIKVLRCFDARRIWQQSNGIDTFGKTGTRLEQ